MLRFVFATGLLALSAPAFAASPSFNCARASGADERAICRSPALSAADRRLAGYYRDIQHCSMMGGRGTNIDLQREWLAVRAHCGANRACLTRLYRIRIAEFAPRAAKGKAWLRAGECPRNP